MPNEKLPLRKALQKNKLLTFFFTLAAFPNLIIAAIITYYLGEMLNYDFVGRGDWAFEFKFFAAGSGLMIFIILYIFFRFTLKNKIHLSVVTALSVNLIIFTPFLIEEYVTPPLFFKLTLGIEIWFRFLFQLFIFGAFTIAISLLDRHTALKAWKRIIIAFALALPVGAFMSWVVLAQMEKLYFALRGP
jgi:hypothetical protein